MFLFFSWMVLEQVSKSFFLALNGSERNSGCFSLLRNGSERNSGHFLSSSEWFWTKLQSSKCFSILQNGSERNFELFGMARNEILSVDILRNRLNSDGMNQTFRLFRVPRNIFFLRKWQPYSMVAASTISHMRIWGCYELIAERGHFDRTIMGTPYGTLGPDSQRQFVTGINV